MDAPLVPPQGHGSIQEGSLARATSGASMQPPVDSPRGTQTFVSITALMGGSTEARNAANTILEELNNLPSWPQPIRDHFERMLKNSDEGWKQMARDLVTWHSATDKKDADKRLLRG